MWAKKYPHLGQLLLALGPNDYRLCAKLHSRIIETDAGLYPKPIRKWDTYGMLTSTPRQQNLAACETDFIFHV